MFFDDIDLPTRKKARMSNDPAHVGNFAPMERVRTDLPMFSDDELWQARGGTLVCDVECYSNFFCVSFTCVETYRSVYFELSPRNTMDLSKLEWILWNFQIVTFNGNCYDIPILAMACAGYGCEQLKAASDQIIQQDIRPSQIAEMFNVVIPKINHIDLIELPIGVHSLKVYASRLHAPRMQDLPYPHDHVVCEHEADVIKWYNVNDNHNTILLYNSLKAQIDLRETLSKEYNQDLRSRSDAQIAEHVLKAEIEKKTGRKIKRPEVEPGTVIKYKVPDYLEYRNKELSQLLETIRNAEFIVSESGGVGIPKEISEKKIRVHQTYYKIGIGGLHSCEETVSHIAVEDGKEGFMVIDRDVESYYPNMILNQKLAPKHLGQDFLDVYKTIVDRRIAAKKAMGKIKKRLTEIENELKSLP